VAAHGSSAAISSTYRSARSPTVTIDSLLGRRGSGRGARLDEGEHAPPGVVTGLAVLGGGAVEE
jgi:hypothetical protein